MKFNNLAIVYWKSGIFMGNNVVQILKLAVKINGQDFLRRVDVVSGKINPSKNYPGSI